MKVAVMMKDVTAGGQGVGDSRVDVGVQQQRQQQRLVVQNQRNGAADDENDATSSTCTPPPVATTAPVAQFSSTACRNGGAGRAASTNNPQLMYNSPKHPPVTTTPTTASAQHHHHDITDALTTPVISNRGVRCPLPPSLLELPPPSTAAAAASALSSASSSLHHHHHHRIASSRSPRSSLPKKNYNKYQPRTKRNPMLAPSSNSSLSSMSSESTDSSDSSCSSSTKEEDDDDDPDACTYTPKKEQEPNTTTSTKPPVPASTLAAAAARFSSRSEEPLVASRDPAPLCSEAADAAANDAADGTRPASKRNSTCTTNTSVTAAASNLHDHDHHPAATAPNSSSLHNTQRRRGGGGGPSPRAGSNNQHDEQQLHLGSSNNTKTHHRPTKKSSSSSSKPAAVDNFASAVLSLAATSIQRSKYNLHFWTRGDGSSSTGTGGTNNVVVPQQQQEEPQSVAALAAATERGPSSNTAGLVHQQQPPQEEAVTAATLTSTKSRRPQFVRGIPNYGQTCFLNAVLQSLAALDPFVAYLSQIMVPLATLQQHQQLLLGGDDDDDVHGDEQEGFGNTGGTKNRLRMVVTVCSMLLDILDKLNGHDADDNTEKEASSPHVSSWYSSLSSNNVQIDTRPLLRQIGKKYTQFQPRHAMMAVGMEQQDAQEVLSAILGLIVQETELETMNSSSSSACLTNLGGCKPSTTQMSSSLSWSSPHYSARNNNNNNNNNRITTNSLAEIAGIDDDLMTVASSVREGIRSKQKHKEQLASSLPGVVMLKNSPGEDTTTTTTASASWATSNTTTSSSFGNNIIQRDYQCNNLNEVCSPTSSSPTISTTVTTNSTTTTTATAMDQPEEKKQEDFELYVPRVDSEEILFESNHPLPVTMVGQPVCDSRVLVEEEELSDISTREQRQQQQEPLTNLSTSMSIMMTTMSSITPSPLCGWVGSALQCRSCQHVRPIQNAPFLEIPVVPTAVASLLGGGIMRSNGNPPEKSHGRNSGPPCTLEECLEDFTSVERVAEVECRCCTLRAKIEDLEDDVMILQGAVRSQLAQQADVMHLQQELETKQTRLIKLQDISPDDDDQDDLILLESEDWKNSDDYDGIDGVSSTLKPRLQRKDALKRLMLTRLPSVFCVHVQRRYYDPYLNRMSKTTQHVIFGEYLDLAPYCAYGGGLLRDRASRDAPWAGTRPTTSRPVSLAGRSMSTPNPIHYRLTSVIEHRGGAFAGHYVCYRRDPTKEGGWLFISDDVVRSVDWQDVHRCNAYMLFYEAL